MGFEGKVIRIRLTASPVEGKANAALVKFLAEVLDVSRTQIEIVRGEKSKQKLVRIRGQSAAELREKFAGREA